jgi:hypothetical protein
MRKFFPEAQALMKNCLKSYSKKTKNRPLFLAVNFPFSHSSFLIAFCDISLKSVDTFCLKLNFQEAKNIKFL